MELRPPFPFSVLFLAQTKRWIGVPIAPGLLARLLSLKTAEKWRLQPQSAQDSNEHMLSSCVCKPTSGLLCEKWAALQLPPLLLQTHCDGKDQACPRYQKGNLSVWLQHSVDPNLTKTSNVGSGWTPKPSQERGRDTFPSLGVTPGVRLPALLILFTAEKPSN